MPAPAWTTDGSSLARIRERKADEARASAWRAEWRRLFRPLDTKTALMVAGVIAVVIWLTYQFV